MSLLLSNNLLFRGRVHIESGQREALQKSSQPPPRSAVRSWKELLAHPRVRPHFHFCPGAESQTFPSLQRAPCQEESFGIWAVQAFLSQREAGGGVGRGPMHSAVAGKGNGACVCLRRNRKNTYLIPGTHKQAEGTAWPVASAACAGFPQPSQLRGELTTAGQL